MRPVPSLPVPPWKAAAGLSGAAILIFALLSLAFAPNVTARAAVATPTPDPLADAPPAPGLDVYARFDRALEKQKSNMESLSENPLPVPVLLRKTTPVLTTYQGTSFRYLKTLTLRVTAYAPDPRCCYPFAGTTTASGRPVTTNGGHLVAADTDLIPFHCLVLVPGYAHDAPVPVLDRGSAIKGNRLDVLLPTFAQAQKWGVHTVQVKIYQPVK